MFCKQLHCDEARAPQSRPFTTPLISGGLLHTAPQCSNHDPDQSWSIPMGEGLVKPRERQGSD